MIRKGEYTSIIFDTIKKANFPKLDMDDLKTYNKLGRDVQGLEYLELINNIEERGTQRPKYSGNINDVVEVGMNQQGVTRASDNKPVLATLGLGPCVSLVGYEPNHRVGFLTHYTALTKVSDSFSGLLIVLYQLGLTDSAPTKFDVRLIGGWEREDELIRELRIKVMYGAFFNMKIVEEDTGYVGDGSRSVALDTRTGKLFSYEPAWNPNRKRLDELEERRMLIRREADLVYQPK